MHLRPVVVRSPPFADCADLVEMFESPGIETVYQWHRRCTGPRGFRVGRYLRFDPTDVRTWGASQLGEAA